MSFIDFLEDHSHCRRLKANTRLLLIVERLIQTGDIQINLHFDVPSSTIRISDFVSPV